MILEGHNYGQLETSKSRIVFPDDVTRNEDNRLLILFRNSVSGLLCINVQDGFSISAALQVNAKEPKSIPVMGTILWIY